MIAHSPEFVRAVAADRHRRGAQARAAAGGDVRGAVLRAADGDDAAWSWLFSRFTSMIRGVARSHRLSAEDAEDVVQSTWMRLLNGIADLHEPAALPGWLKTTAERESLRVLRRTARERPTDAAILADEPDPEAVVDETPSGLDAAALERALGALTDRQRDVLRAVYGEVDASYADIARSLRMPIGSIGPTHGRAMARLRRDPSLSAALCD
ncbi:MAG TPA: sigma-70 family RNA polymerase sigma factor [Solirubrobacteraceae bacterium]|jgi:RNA polymerase sigma factor (sigma-70 family)